MTQPSFVPIVEADQVRPAYSLKVPRIWTQSRPSELTQAVRPRGAFLGTPGPDQGYALKLARRLEADLVLQPGEDVEDALAGATAVAMRRCASFGRAPVIHDLRFAYTLWGFLGDPPAGLVELRVPLFRSASHRYQTQRAIADAVRETTLRLSPEEIATRLGEWSTLLDLESRGDPAPR